MVWDRIIFGISSNKIHEKLLQQGSELDLQKTIEIAYAYELSQFQLRSMNSNQSNTEINVVKLGITEEENALHGVLHVKNVLRKTTLTTVVKLTTYKLYIPQNPNHSSTDHGKTFKHIILHEPITLTVNQKVNFYRYNQF
jgi:hypothetical protein